jgi:hypothetical protein
MDRPFLDSIIKMKIEASRHRNEDLSEIPVSMPGAFSHCRYIKEEVNTLHLERDVYKVFHDT